MCVNLTKIDKATITTHNTGKSEKLYDTLHEPYTSCTKTQESAYN